MQTILGAGGAVANALAPALTQYTNEIRLVSRNPRAVNPGNQLFPADLTQKDAVREAVKGSEIAYLTVGLPYSTKVWASQWPKIMTNVIDACKQEGCKLVFFDNIYMYDPEYLGNITEETPIKPVSKKGHIRQQVAQMLLDEIQAGGLQGLIARAADFYGPSIRNTSVITELVFNKFHANKPANWFASLEQPHSFTYVPDAAKAMALLGNTPEAYNQVWHLPTAAEPPTGKEWITAIANAMGVKPKIQLVSKTMLRFLGLFNSILREMGEMVYQYDRPYVFNSSKFEQQFSIQPTSYLQGIQEIVDTDYKSTKN